jgi:hypothetical protein
MLNKIYKGLNKDKIGLIEVSFKRLYIKEKLNILEKGSLSANIFKIRECVVLKTF